MTNGTLVTRMNEDFWARCADTGVILLCDSYPIGLPVDEIDRLGREHGVTVEWTEPREEFFKIPIDPAGGHDAAESFRGCQGFNNCPIIRDGRLYPCAYAAFADVFRERFGTRGPRGLGRATRSRSASDPTGDASWSSCEPGPVVRATATWARASSTRGAARSARLDEWTKSEQGEALDDPAAPDESVATDAG